MQDESNINSGRMEKLPRDLEMIVMALMPNLKHIENRFDHISMDIREIGVGLKDTTNRLGSLEKRMDKFEILVDKRFDQLTGELRDFKNDVNRRFEQMGSEFREFKGDVKQRFEQVEKRFEQVDKRFEQVDKRFENVDRRFDQIAASIERLGDKIDARDARQRSFTLRMFGIAISISFLGVLGVLIKTFGVM